MNLKQSLSSILTLCLLSSVLLAQEGGFPEKIETDQFNEALSRVGHTYIGGQPTKPEPSTLKPKLRALFRPQGEGWQVVEVTDEGTSAG